MQSFNASQDAATKGEELYNDFNSDNNNQNAFKHSYWNALMEKRISKTFLKEVSVYPYPTFYVSVEIDFAKLFSDAHEYGSSGLSTAMDCSNNEKGRSYGAFYKNLTDHNIALELSKGIGNGDFVRIANGILVPTNWEELKPQFLFITTAFANGLSITGVLCLINSDLEIPSQINGQAIVKIDDLAFSNQTFMTKVIIPSSITYIGQSAFQNTNSALLFLQGRITVPNSFDISWNSSNNPVYLNNIQCLHESKTLVYLDSTKHGDLCIICRTIANTESHLYANFIWKNYNQHSACCECESIKLQGHVISSSDIGFPYKACLLCGGLAKLGFVQLESHKFTAAQALSTFVQEYFGNNSYLLSNGIYVISDIDLESFYNGTLVLPELFYLY